MAARHQTNPMAPASSSCAARMVMSRMAPRLSSRPDHGPRAADPGAAALLLVLLRLLRGSLADLFDDTSIGQRGRVTQLAALGDVAQEAAHDLAGPGLGQLVG